MIVSDSVDELELIHKDASEEVRVILEALDFEAVISDMQVMKEIILQSKAGSVKEDIYKGLQSICVLTPDLSRREITLQKEVHCTLMLICMGSRFDINLFK